MVSQQCIPALLSDVCYKLFHCVYGRTIAPQSTNSVSLSFLMQVEADDVLTKEEQIGLLFKAKRKCEVAISNKHKPGGE